MDITEHKQTEEALKRERYYLAKAQEIGGVGTWDLDIKKNKLVWTDEVYRIFGIPAGTELTYETFLNCVHPNDREYVDKKWKAALNNEPYDIEHRILVDGHVKWVREKAELEFDAKGNCVRGIGFTQDITERRKAEEERENLLHDMGERVKDLTCMYSVAKSIRQRDTLESIFQDVVKFIPPGWHYPEITCARVCFDGSEYISDSFKETQWKQVSDLIVDGEQRGSVEVYYLEEKPTLDEGPFLKEERNLIDGIARALSEAIERKRAEEQIENLAKFPSENPNPVLRVAGDGRLLYANEASKPLVAEWECHIGQAVPENWRQIISEVFASGSYRRVEAEHAGRVFAFVVAPVPEADYVNLYGRDITERKEIAARQRLAEQILECLNREVTGSEVIRNVLELVKESTGFAAVGVRLQEGDDFPYFETKGFSKNFVKAENYLCVRDKNGKQIYDSQGNPVLECMCGNVLSGRTDPALPFFTEGGSFWTNSTTKLLTSTSLEDLQTPVRSRCNKAGYESVGLIPLRSRDQIVGLLQLNDTQPGRFSTETIRFFEEIGVSIGIALARIRAEEDVKNLAKFPAENPNPVLRISGDATILYNNKAASELLDISQCQEADLMLKHLHKYTPKALKLSELLQTEMECCSKVYSLTFAPVVDSDYVNVYGLDITSRKQAEENLRKYKEHLEELVQTRTGELAEANKQLLQEIEQRKYLEKEILNVSEREQRRIGQELHDSLGQQLTGISFMSKVLEHKLAEKSLDETTDVAEITNLVTQASGQARRLAKGLHPVDLDAGTLMSALQELASSTESLFGIRCTFKSDKPVKVDDAEVAVHLYRITQEAVTNAIKHSRAKNIQIGLTYGRDKSILTVKSDGLDFPEEFEARGTGMGLQIMDHRADIISGSLDIHRAPEGGTIVTCTFPNKKH